MKWILAVAVVLVGVTSACADTQASPHEPYVVPQGIVDGGQFIDRFLPVEPNGPLRSDVWGADNVLPRDVLNGMEDQDHSYWGGNLRQTGRWNGDRDDAN